VAKWSDRYRAGAVSAQQLFQPMADSQLERVSHESLELSLGNLICQVRAELNTLFSTDSDEARRFDDYSQIQKLIHEMCEISESTQFTISQKSNLIFSKADDLVNMILEFYANHDWPLSSNVFNRIQSLLSKSNIEYNSLNTFYELVISIGENEDVGAASDAFKSISKLLSNSFDIFRNESRLLNTLKNLSNVYISSLSKIDFPSAWASDFKSTCLKIIALIENGGNSELISFEVDGETIYLSPDSAEGKALDRIRESNGDTSHWETVMQPGEAVDLEEISSWLEVNGFIQ
jgi:hypothetical protein